MKLKKLNLTNVVGIKELIKYKKLKNINNKNRVGNYKLTRTLGEGAFAKVKRK